MKIVPKSLILSGLLVLGFSLFPKLASAFTCTAVAAGGNWSAASTWSSCNSTVPQAQDDVVLDATSGSVAVDTSTNSLKSFDMTGYTGTLSGSSNITVAPSSGSTVTKFAGTISWTGTLNLSPAVTATTTLTSNGKTLNSITVAAASGAHVVFADGVTTGSTRTVTLTSGHLHVDGASDNSGLTHSWGLFNTNSSSVRSLYFGTASISMTQSSATVWNAATITNLTVPANTATITLTGVGSISFAGGGSTYYNVVFNGPNISPDISGANTFTNLTFTGPANKTTNLSLGANQTVTGTLSLNGNSSTNRFLFSSGTLGTARTVTVNGAVSASNVDFRDITGAGSASWDLSAISGGSGDALGNSGITFTTGQTNYWVGNGGSWSDSSRWASTSGGTGGTGRVPLPQDNARIDSNFTSSQAVTADMPRLGKDIDFTGMTWTGASTSFAPTSVTIYGSLTHVSGMRYGSGNNTFTFACRGSCTITSNGVDFNKSPQFSMFGGTLTMQDAFSSSNAGALTNGTLDANNFNLSFSTFSLSGSSARTLNMGSGTWTLSGVSTPWNAGTITNLTFNKGSAPIVFSSTNSSAKTFSGGGLTYNDLSIISGGSGAVTISGSNTFNKLTINAPKTVTFTAGTTQRLNRLVALGTQSNPITLQSSSASVATLSMPGANTFVGDWLSITNITATGGAKWYAGANSTLSNSIGWLLEAGPQRRGSFIQDAKVRLEKGKVIIRGR